MPSQLAASAELYVNDAFGCAHRTHASTAGVTAYLQPAVAGLLMKKVLIPLSAPEQPFTQTGLCRAV